MTGKQNAPEIRFEGFTDPWEQRKLGELIQLGGSGGTPSANNPDYYGGDIPFLSIADINGREITNTAKTLTDEGLLNSAAWIVPSGAVSLAMYASVGKVGIIRQDAATSQAFYNMVFDNEALRDFVFTRLEKAETDSEWEPYISTGTQRNLNADKVKSFSLDVPSNEEASEISAYFANLDTLITLHQRKCQYRSLYGYLSWEQRKLGDCFEFLKNNTLSRAGLNGENGTARNVHYGDILIKFGDCLDGERNDLPFITDDTVLPKFAGSILREGDVIFADTAEDEAAGKCVELRKLPKEPTISGLHTIPARPRFPFGTGYLGHYLNSDAYHRQLLPLMQGIKVIFVSKAALQDTQVRFPGLSEQTVIGAALSEIDTLITLHQ